MANKPDTALLRQLPQVEEALHQPAIRELAGSLPHDVLVEAVRNEIGRIRAAILAGSEPAFTTDVIAKRAATAASGLKKPSLRRVINASGVIIHTNLGRSVLAPEAVEAVNDAIRGYSTLEYDTQKMARGSRHAHCESLICALTGAEAAIAVNNNAAAVMMVLREFASGHEAIVSRGELVEIGGAFRIPDIMELSDATMVEVGTTNKTHPRDYERAITPETAMLLKVHQSNYRMLG
ncbi:MAG: L-seryl-tRNA(Sec) selenium transferase, partial [Coriobacteriia bacterium]|nr:L-seryl-tRNA(Sec) selenium transferase [Coriobacteriia bacterium]